MDHVEGAWLNGRVRLSGYAGGEGRAGAEENTGMEGMEAEDDTCEAGWDDEEGEAGAEEERIGMIGYSD